MPGDLGDGQGDQYAHNVPAGYLPQEQLPDDIRGAELYEPAAFGFEKDVTKRFAWWAELRDKMTRERGG